MVFKFSVVQALEVLDTWKKVPGHVTVTTALPLHLVAAMLVTRPGPFAPDVQRFCDLCHCMRDGHSQQVHCL